MCFVFPFDIHYILSKGLNPFSGIIEEIHSFTILHNRNSLCDFLGLHALGCCPTADVATLNLLVAQFKPE